MNKETRQSLIAGSIAILVTCAGVAFLVLVADAVTREDYQASINSVKFIAGPGIECDKEISLEMEHAVITCRLSEGEK